ncbi:MAG: DUF4139 domain-containing protein [Acidobacteriota bacterium]|nr:DUF4139 domain-containing protein [Acidobacteriota bacterium]
MLKLRTTFLCSAAAIIALHLTAPAQQGGAAPVALTIYNQNFAVARTTVDLDLKSGLNEITTTNVTSQLEPDSVVLRDPSGKIPFKVTEQNYDAGVIDQNSLLEKFEGKTIQFQTNPTISFSAAGPTPNLPTLVDGKIVRAGNQPLIEVNGHLQFSLPGEPLFPSSTDGLLLKPTLRWQIDSPRPAHLAAELAYITNGMSWQATYNVVAPESSATTATEPVDLIGWITMQNNTGTDFPSARIKLMAGDVAKIQNMSPRPVMMARAVVFDSVDAGAAVTQQAFDDFHLYDLNRTVSLINKETKQVQFIQASAISMARIYEYDGSTTQPNYNCPGCHNDQPTSGATSNTKVTVRAEIKNSTANHLGLPLPAGRIRLYRRDSAGQMEFIGEGTIPHTPTDETVKVPVGSAFDVTGSRKQTDFRTDQRAHTTDETFSITVKNQKTTPIQVAVVEHMNRAQNWQLTEQQVNAQPTKSTKRDSTTIEFPITVQPAGETTVTYSVRYTW